MQTINNRQTYKTPEFYNSKEARHKVIEGELVVCSGPVRVGKQQVTLKKLVHKHVRHIYIYVHAYTYYIYIFAALYLYVLSIQKALYPFSRDLVATCVDANQFFQQLRLASKM